VTSGGAAELLLESPALHPAHTSSPQREAVASNIRATRSMFMVRFSLEIMALQNLFRPAWFRSRGPGISGGYCALCACEDTAFRRVHWCRYRGSDCSLNACTTEDGAE